MSDILTDNPVVLDLQAAIANIRRQGSPARVFQFEHGIEPGLKQALCERFGLCAGLRQDHEHSGLARDVRVHQFAGLEFMRVFPPGLVWRGLPADTTSVPPAAGPIRTWADFESYPWPSVAAVDFSGVEWLERNLPDNMAMWSMTYVFQMVSNLLGFEPMCMMLYEERALVKAVADKVGAVYAAFTDTFCQFRRVGAINVGDDMGYKGGTFINPDDIREIFIPWHTRIIAAARKHGKLGIFHVCGRVDAIMDDLIDTVRIDAKHSTQDVIETIGQTRTRWGDRVALLGGVDIDFVTRAQPNQVAGYTRKILEECAAGCGFALGLGNWVADSVPLENYLAVLAEARRLM